MRGPESHRNCPSKRYLGLVLDGAIASGIDGEYVSWLKQQEAYEFPNDAPAYLKAIFRILALPVFAFYMIGVPFLRERSALNDRLGCCASASRITLGSLFGPWGR